MKIFRPASSTLSLVIAATLCLAATNGPAPIRSAQDRPPRSLAGSRYLLMRDHNALDGNGKLIEDTAGSPLTVREGEIAEFLAIEEFRDADGILQPSLVAVGRVTAGPMAGKRVCLFEVQAGAPMHLLVSDALPLPVHPPPWLDTKTLKNSVSTGMSTRFLGPNWRSDGVPPTLVPGTSVETLARALHEPGVEWQVRFYAAVGLFDSSDPSALTVLAGVLGDPSREVRELAESKLTYLVQIDYSNDQGKHPELLTPLMPILLQQLRQHPQQSSVVNILRLAGPQVVPAMAELITEPYTQATACSAASVMVQFPKESREYLSLLLRAALAGNNWAIHAASEVDLGLSLRQFTARLTSTDDSQRARAAEALFLMGPLRPAQLSEVSADVDATLAALAQRIRNLDRATLRESVRALPWFGNRARPLIKELEDLAARKDLPLSAEEIRDVIRRIEATP